MKLILINKSIPFEFKKSQIILLYKKGDRNKPLNNHPTTLNNTILKILDSIIL